LHINEKNQEHYQRYIFNCIYRFICNAIKVDFIIYYSTTSSPLASTAAVTNYQIASRKADQPYNSKINNYNNKDYNNVLHLQYQFSGGVPYTRHQSITTTYDTPPCGTDKDASTSVANDDDDSSPTAHITYIHGIHTIPIHIRNHTIILHHHSTKFCKQQIDECNVIASSDCSSARSYNLSNVSKNFESTNGFDFKFLNLYFLKSCY
jgi:hypothetical protein